MATFLDTLGVLDYFAPIFSALLVFAIVYSILQKVQILGDNKVIHSLIAISLGILVLLIPDLVDLINFIAPWFVVVFIFVVLLLMTYQMFGLKEENIVHYMINDKSINWTIIAIGLIIILAGIFVTFGERALQTGAEQTGFQANLFSIIFNPKVLGLLLILGISVFTIAFLGGATTSNGGGGDHGGGGHH